MASAGKEEMDLLLAQVTHLKNVLWYFLTYLGSRSCKISPGRVEANSLTSLSGWFLNFPSKLLLLGKIQQTESSLRFLKIEA